MPDLNASTTLFPQAPLLSQTSGATKFTSRSDPERWTAVGQDAWTTVDTAINARQALEENLRVWLALVEMQVDDGGENERWENAANLFVPVVPTELRAMVSYLAAQVFVQRFIIVAGNTDEAAKDAQKVERYYNAELVRQRGQTTWLQDLKDVEYLGLRDGTGILETVWRKTVRDKLTPTFEPVLDGDGQIQFDDDGEVISERKVVKQRVTSYDDVHYEAVQLKDFGVVPAEARSIEEAAACWKVEWLMEERLREMIEAGDLDEDEVEKMLVYNPDGTSDTDSDRQGVYDKTAGGQIDIGLAQGSLTSPTFKNRGPFKVYRIHTRQHDLNDDGKVEENVVWVHDLSQRMIGWKEYEYLVEERPFHTWCPFPRHGSVYGYSLVELLQDLQGEINSIRNDIRDAIDLILNPPLVENQSVEIDNKGVAWGPGVKWTVEGEADKAIKFLQVTINTLEAMQGAAWLDGMVARVTGQGGPMLGAQNSKRETATEARQQQAAYATRTSDIAMNFRYFCRNVFNFTHRLKLNYLPANPSFDENGQKYVVSRAVLAKDYRIEVAGASDPVDAATRRTETMTNVSAMVKTFPMLMQDPVKAQFLLQKWVDSLDWAGADVLIGTAEEAQQQRAAMQAQQQAQAALAAGGAGGQQPGQPGQQQPGVAPPGPEGAGGLAALLGGGGRNGAT